MYVTDQLPPIIHSVVIWGFPVANSCPTGQLNVTIVPNAVSLLDASAPNPGRSGGQSENTILIIFLKHYHHLFRV